MLPRFVIASLPRSKCLLISWLHSPSAVILEPPQNRFSHCFHCFSICHEVMGLDARILVFCTLSFKPTFSLSSFIKRLFSSSSLSAIRVLSSAYLRVVMYGCESWTVKKAEHRSPLDCKEIQPVHSEGDQP